MSEVEFWVLINHKFQRVRTTLDILVVDLFLDLQKYSNKVIPAKLSHHNCMFYQLLSPVSAAFKNSDQAGGDISDQIMDTCLVKSNRKCFDPKWTKVHQLAKDLSPDRVHLVIDFPDPYTDSNTKDKGSLGIFEAEDIQRILCQRNCRIEHILHGDSRIAVVTNKTSDEYGYLKFVKQEQEVEVETLQYLSQIESPSNHTISGVKFWSVQGGTVVSMPAAGGWLTALKRPSKKLWSVAQQLFEAIAFMHEHNVAHMDINPQNVLIPPHGGRLSIIDFGASVRVRGPNVRYKGITGTEGYIAPELIRGVKFKPLLADLWSCGRTLAELCFLCSPSADRTDLLVIASHLMNQDPEARPKLSAVLQWMASAQRGDEIAAYVAQRLVNLPPVTPL